MPAVLTARTWRGSEYWPWSYSPRSRPVSRRPVPEMVTPVFQQPLERGPLAQHRAEHVCLGVVGRTGQQRQQRLGMRARVVVEHPDPLGVGAELVEVREPGTQGGGETRR